MNLGGPLDAEEKVEAMWKVGASSAALVEQKVLSMGEVKARREARKAGKGGDKVSW